MCRRPKTKCLESYIQLYNWHFPNIQRQLWIIPYYDLGLFTKKPTISQYILTPPSSFKTLWNKHWKFAYSTEKKEGHELLRYFILLFKKKKRMKEFIGIPNVHTKESSFMFTQAEQKQKTKKSLQQLILVLSCWNLGKAESISEKSIHKEISKCPMVLFVHGADQSPWLEEGAGAVRKQSPVSLL